MTAADLLDAQRRIQVDFDEWPMLRLDVRPGGAAVEPAARRLPCDQDEPHSRGRAAVPPRRRPAARPRARRPARERSPASGATAQGWDEALGARRSLLAAEREIVRVRPRRVPLQQLLLGVDAARRAVASAPAVLLVGQHVGAIVIAQVGVEHDVADVPDDAASRTGTASRRADRDSAPSGRRCRCTARRPRRCRNSRRASARGSGRRSSARGCAR